MRNDIEKNAAVQTGAGPQTHTSQIWSHSFAFSSVCVFTGVKPSYREHHSFEACREREMVSPLPSLPNTYTYTHTAPHEVSRISWFEEGMYPSLSVNDNMG